MKGNKKQTSDAGEISKSLEIWKRIKWQPKNAQCWIKQNGKKRQIDSITRSREGMKLWHKNKWIFDAEKLRVILSLMEKNIYFNILHRLLYKKYTLHRYKLI